MYASITRSWASIAKRSVMLTLIPSDMSRLTATAPSTVPGTFTITLGRSTVFHSRRASSIAASELCDTPGEISIET